MPTVWFVGLMILCSKEVLRWENIPLPAAGCGIVLQKGFHPILNLVLVAMPGMDPFPFACRSFSIKMIQLLEG